MVIPLRDIQPRQTFPFVTIAFIVCNFVLFFYELSLGPDLNRFFVERAFIPAAFFEEGVLASVPAIFLSMFLHGGWAHLLGNMLYLWIFGDNVEDRLGHVRYILFYVACGVGATLAHAYSNPDSVVPSIGASGAIAGVLGAYLAIFPKARVLTLIPLGYFLRVTELPALIVLGLWFVMQIFSGFASLSAQTAQSAGVAWWAHIGGFVVGLLVGLVVRRQGPPQRRWSSTTSQRTRFPWLGVLLLPVILLAAQPQDGWSQGQVLIPTQQHDKLTFEMHSIGDDVMFYMGDPQAFLALTARPGSIPPLVNFTNTARSAVLRILDQTLFEDMNPTDSEYYDDEWGDEPAQQSTPEEQRWEVRLSPASPGTFVIYVELGSGVFDFTDMEVHDVYLQGDSTRIEVEFNRPNIVPLKRFKITVAGGELEFRGMLNARAESVTLQIPRTECRIDLRGKPFEGLSEIYFEDVPESLEITVSRKIGVRVSGLAANVVRFDHKDMRRDGSSLVTANYADNKCKVNLHFARPIPRLDVEWD